MVFCIVIYINNNQYINDVNNVGSTNPQFNQVSYPIEADSQTNIINSEYYKDYLTNDIQIATVFPFDNDYFQDIILLT